MHFKRVLRIQIRVKNLRPWPARQGYESFVRPRKPVVLQAAHPCANFHRLPGHDELTIERCNHLDLCRAGQTDIEQQHQQNQRGGPFGPPSRLVDGHPLDGHLLREIPTYCPGTSLLVGEQNLPEAPTFGGGADVACQPPARAVWQPSTQFVVRTQGDVIENLGWYKSFVVKDYNSCSCTHTTGANSIL
eukprot:1572978-Rhodomonas_salina.2